MVAVVGAHDLDAGLDAAGDLGPAPGLAGLVLAGRVLAVVYQLGGDAAAGCRPRGSRGGRGLGARGLAGDVAQELQRVSGDRWRRCCRLRWRWTLLRRLRPIP
jgi:hypothetical protein